MCVEVRGIVKQEEYLSIPGHISAKEAAVLLKVTEDQIWYYIRTKSLPARKVSGRFMIPQSAIKTFRVKPRGRVRSKPVPWRIYHAGAIVQVLQIEVHSNPDRREELQTRIRIMLEEQTNQFKGTVLRHILFNEENPSNIIIQLIWKNTELADEAMLEHDLEAFKADFADVLGWETARYKRLQALIHT